MTAKLSETEGHLQIDAHVLRQLGDQLISDPEQALLELIKNCYDADAEWARVRVRTEGATEITVEDNGCGMDLETIHKGWLFISVSAKRAFKQLGKVTPRFKRTPLGDKGLGRLGTLRLGGKVRIETCAAAGASGYRVNLDWARYHSGVALSLVPVEIERIPGRTKTGTTITVLALQDPDYWRGERRLQSLQKNLIGLISPFEEFANFAVTISIDGSKVELRSLPKEVREEAPAALHFSWDDQALQCTLKVKARHFHSKPEEVAYEELIARDNGKSFLERLSGSRGAAGFGLKASKEKRWWLELSARIDWPDIIPKGDKACPPGPFTGEILAVEFDDIGLTGKSLTHLAELRTIVKVRAGVTIYRDGFGIRMEDDWLGLGRSFTQASNYYGFRPANTIGFVAISSRANPQLQEKSDREGFVDTEASVAFFEIVHRAVKFGNDGLGFLRRQFRSAVNDRTAKKANLKENWTAQDALARLEVLSSEARRGRTSLQKVREQHAETLAKVTARLSRAAKQSGSVDPKSLASLVTEANQAALALRAALVTVEETLQRLEEMERVSGLVRDRFTSQQQQMRELYEIAGIGLTAQALAHDLHELLDDLMRRSTRAGRKTLSPELVGYIEAVKASTMAIRKQVALLDPMALAARERKQEFSAFEFVRDYASLREEHLTRMGIRMSLLSSTDFDIRMNRGRLLRVLDNLIRNSEYWVSNSKTNGPEITVEVQRPRLLISDNGPGVNPRLEDTLFDVFVSDKPRGHGGGLGLFIARELMDAESCGVVLLPQRNRAGRRYQFAIDLSGVES